MQRDADEKGKSFKLSQAKQLQFIISYKLVFAFIL